MDPNSDQPRGNEQRRSNRFCLVSVYDCYYLLTTAVVVVVTVAIAAIAAIAAIVAIAAIAAIAVAIAISVGRYCCMALAVVLVVLEVLMLVVMVNLWRSLSVTDLWG